MSYPNYPIPAVVQPPYQQNFNPYGQIQNPYMDRMNQLQQYQQVLQMPPTQMSGTSQQAQVNQQQILSCAIVDDFNSIVANDVPMDGKGAIFMKRDGSEMQWRNWASNGTIVTTPYKPILEQNQAEQTNIPQMDFNALNEDVRALREEISDRFDRLEKTMGGVASKTTARGKKAEVSENE